MKHFNTFLSTVAILLSMTSITISLIERASLDKTIRLRIVDEVSDAIYPAYRQMKIEPPRNPASVKEVLAPIIGKHG